MLLVPLLLLLVTAGSLWPGLAAGPSLDAAVFLLVGQRLAAGDALYVEIWDHKMPGIHTIDALAAAMPWPDPWQVVWALSVLATALTALFVYLTLRLRADRVIALGASVACAIGLSAYPISLGGGMSESFAVLPAAAARGVAGTGIVVVRRAAIAGLLGGLAVVVSIQLLPALPALLLLVTLRQRRWDCGLAFVAGGASILLAMIIILVVAGTLAGFVDAVISYSAAYRATLADAANRDSAASIFASLAVLGFLWVPAMVGFVVMLLRRGARQSLEWASVTWLLMATLAALLQGRYYTHYAIVVVLPLIVLAAAGASALGRHLSRTLAWRAGVAVVYAAVMMVAVTAARNGTDPYVAAQAVERHRIEVVGHQLRAVAGADGRLFVWGDAPGVYSASGLAPALPYVYLSPLLTPGYATPELIEALAAELAAHPPLLVLDAGSSDIGQPGKPPLFKARQVIADDGRTLDILEPLRVALVSRYVLDGVIEGWPVYRLAE